MREFSVAPSGSETDMNRFKILILAVLSGGIALVVFQNLEALLPVIPLRVHWPGLLSAEYALPIYALLAVLLVAGFALTSLPYLGEHLRLRRSLAKSKREAASLEQQLQPDPEPEPESGSGSGRASPSDPLIPERREAIAARVPVTESSVQTDQIPVESMMEKASPAHELEDKSVDQDPIAGEQSHTDARPMESSKEQDVHHAVDASEPSAPQAASPVDKPRESAGMPLSDQSPPGGDRIMDEQEVLVRPSSPGWGSVLLLSAALALVVGSGVYIVLNDKISRISDQLTDLHILSGHTASIQDEMGRVWELERVEVRDELDVLISYQQQLSAGVANLEEQMVALQALPEVLRKRLVAGFLRDAAGTTAFLGTQVETEDQRHTLEQIEEMLQKIAIELEEAGEGR